MSFDPATLADLLDHGFDTVIDVRSPAEFDEDHIPGAVNLPALSNAERARVGTIYKQDSPFTARKIGAALVARNVALHLEGPLAEKSGGWRPLVHCWRGGQRSGSVAAILTQIGWRAETLAGGYRGYRRLVVTALYDQPWPAPIVLLDGNTGTAKTAILSRLAGLGVQTLDLEGLAGHRGSILGQRPGGQPSQKAFEGRLAAQRARLDPARPVVIEAESSKVGDRNLPPRLWEAMHTAPRIEVRAPVEARARYLAEAYEDLGRDTPALIDVLEALIPYHGRAVVADWTALVQAGEGAALARDLIERHYDPRYAKSRARRPAPVMAQIDAGDLSSDDLDRMAHEIADQISSIRI